MNHTACMGSIFRDYFCAAYGRIFLEICASIFKRCIVTLIYLGLQIHKEINDHRKTDNRLTMKSKKQNIDINIVHSRGQPEMVVR